MSSQPALILLNTQILIPGEERVLKGMKMQPERRRIKRLCDKRCKEEQVLPWQGYGRAGMFSLRFR
jgi:hypothetical protein